MKIKIKKEIEVNIKTLKVNAHVRYWEDSRINGIDDTKDGLLIPCKEGNSWCPVIDIDSGKILNWQQGTTANIHYKVCDEGTYALCDEGTYALFDELDNLILTIDGYVPNIMYPKEEGYGDYIIYGHISRWFNYEL